MERRCENGVVGGGEAGRVKKRAQAAKWRHGSGNGYSLWPREAVLFSRVGLERLCVFRHERRSGHGESLYRRPSRASLFVRLIPTPIARHRPGRRAVRGGHSAPERHLHQLHLPRPPAWWYEGRISTRSLETRHEQTE